MLLLSWKIPTTCSHVWSPTFSSFSPTERILVEQALSQWWNGVVVMN
jgi:hypothetical protein